MLPRDTPLYRSKRPWPDWPPSAASTAWKNSSKINVLVSNSELFCYTEFVCLSTILSGFSLLLYHPQWNCLDWVSEQHWWSRRHPVPSKRRRHEGCTASLAQIWGNYNITTFICVETFHTSIENSSYCFRNGVKVCCDVLWQGQIATKFSESSLEAILSAIPEDLPSQDLCPWFKTVFIPFVRRVLPQGQVGNSPAFLNTIVSNI